MYDKSDVVISDVNDNIIAIYRVGEYNSLPNVDEIFEEYDVANIGDIVDDAKLCDDWEFFNKVMDYR